MAGIECNSSLFVNAAVRQVNMTGANISNGNFLGADVTDITWSDTLCPDFGNSGVGPGATCCGSFNPGEEPAAGC
jgi:hypothetical protein